jgi:hypothetical protein
MRRLTLALFLLIPAAFACAEPSYPGTKLVDFFGYTGCLQLSNADTRVILDPNCGGRVLSYQNSGLEAIPLNPAQQGYTWQPGGKVVDVYGGRFDVGPEMTLPRHLDLWIGRWRGHFTGPREAELISPIDSNTKLQLVRTFRLDERTSHLRCTQKIINRGTVTRRCCHWSRTFAMGNGIAIVPLNPLSRFPRKYLTYGPGNVMDYSPRPSENVRVRDGFLEIKGDPPFSKFMADPVGPTEQDGVSRAWLAYLLQTGRLFVKRFPVYPQRAYAEACAASLSLYYYPFTEDRQKPADKRPLPIDFCELEPIGPQEILAPNQSASFTEDWYLLPQPFPQPGTDLDLKAIEKLVTDQTN